MLILQILLLGLFRQPKWGHLKELHAAIKSCSTTLLQGVQRNFSLGELQEVSALNIFSPTCLFSLTAIQIFIGFFSPFHFDQGYVFEEEKGECVAFLINNDKGNTVSVQFNNSSYKLLPKSISILPDCQNVAFNTAHVSYNFVRINYTCNKLINLVIFCSILVLLII